jgi:prepilin-type N-terminal cleavage/methylation domain-containing protein
MRNINTNRGFTLVEALVSTAIFVVVISALTAAFVYISKLQRRTNAIRAANDNVRYVSDFLSKEIRNGALTSTSASPIGQCGEYANDPSSQSSNWLQIVNVSGDLECFFLGTAEVGFTPPSLSASGPELWIVKQPAGAAVPLNPQALNLNYAQITNLTFTVYNYDLATPALQPFVTIQGSVISNKDPQNIVSVPFETSISLQTIE